MWQRFTERARRIVFAAQEAAQKYGVDQIGPEHLLVGVLVQDRETVASQALKVQGVKLDQLLIDVEEACRRSDNQHPVELSLSVRAERVISLSYEEARNLNVDYIGAEHLLLGLIREGDGITGDAFRKHNIELERTRAAVLGAGDSEDDSWKAKPNLGLVLPEDLLSLLIGGSLLEHVALCLTADAGQAGAAIREQCKDLPALRARLRSGVVKNSAEGVSPANSSTLSRLLAAANEEAAGSSLQSKHLLLALARKGNLDEAGLTFERTRDLLGGDP